MEGTQVAEASVRTVLLSETVFSDLPAAVRKLIAAYGTPIPSGDRQVFSFEVGALRWEEIKLELVGTESSPGDPRGPWVLITHYANDYCCQKDSARWTGINCEGVEADNCPVCEMSTDPETSDQYIVIRRGLAVSFTPAS